MDMPSSTIKKRVPVKNSKAFMIRQIFTTITCLICYLSKSIILIQNTFFRNNLPKLSLGKYKLMLGEKVRESRKMWNKRNLSKRITKGGFHGCRKGAWTHDLQAVDPIPYF